MCLIGHIGKRELRNIREPLQSGFQAPGSLGDQARALHMTGDSIARMGYCKIVRSPRIHAADKVWWRRFSINRGDARAGNTRGGSADGQTDLGNIVSVLCYSGAQWFVGWPGPGGRGRKPEGSHRCP